MLSLDSRRCLEGGNNSRQDRMKIDSKDFRVTEKDKVDLEKWPTKGSCPGSWCNFDGLSPRSPAWAGSVRLS